MTAPTPDALRTLYEQAQADRDRLQGELVTAEICSDRMQAQRDQARAALAEREAEVGRLTEENERLREALSDAASALAVAADHVGCDWSDSLFGKLNRAAFAARAASSTPEQPADAGGEVEHG